MDSCEQSIVHIIVMWLRMNRAVDPRDVAIYDLFQVEPRLSSCKGFGQRALPSQENLICIVNYH